MIPSTRQRLDSNDPHETLNSLGAGLFSEADWIGLCETVDPRNMPAAARSLLDHQRHMTATLNAHYGEPVALRVLEAYVESQSYRRKILLTVEQGRRVVEFGLVRLDLSVLPEPARADVISKMAPLGEIFTRHNILTRVEPRWFLRFAGNGSIVQCFAPAPPLEAFGRLGVIHCDGRPAALLLEVVRGDGL